jgi:4-carboxymuconolactone decarboxylase
MQPGGAPGPRFSPLTSATDGEKARGMTRIPLPDPAQFAPEQERVAADIRSGPRGEVRGPFLALLHSPETASRIAKLGEHLRFGGVLPPALKELAILVAARHWSCAYEWSAHRPLAERAGIRPATADAIAAGRTPADLDEEESVVYRFCTELHRSTNVSDATLAAAQRFGAPGIIELTAICGYYAMIAMVLNVAGVEPSEGGATLPASDAGTPPTPTLPRKGGGGRRRGVG